MRVVALALTLTTGCGFSARAAAIDARNGALDSATDALGDARLDAARDARTIDASPPPPIVFRQIKNTEGQSLAAPVVTMGPVAAGDLLVVFVGWYKAGTVASVADSASDSFALAVGPTVSGTETQSIYYACGVAASAADAVTVRFATANQDPDVRVVDYSGLAATGCLDATHANTGAGTAIDSGAVMPSAANELLVAGDFQVNMTSVGDAAFTTRQISGFGDLVEDRVVAAAGSVTAHATENTAGAWVMQIAAFRGQ